MKRFIIISLLSVMALPMPACLWIDTHNSYLFSAYNHREFQDQIYKVCNDNWKAYLGSTEEYFWFNADEIIEAARQKGDALMVSYVQNLKKYLDCVSVEQQKQYSWNYPTKEEIDQCTRDLQAVRTYALGKIKTKLRSQHALLYMRCNMMLGRHQENVTFWEQTASQYIETVYKDMMKNIYAGALYKTGHEAQAGEMFAEMGDYNSLMTQYYNKRSYQAIRQHYNQNPTSKVLPFLVQDFVNNAQEAIDTQEEEFPGKLFIRDINKQEIWQMRNFCEQVVRDGKTDTPILWKTAKAWLEYMYGDKSQALSDIFAATKLDGTERMKDCARIIMLYITTRQAKDSEAFDDYLADEMRWLDERQSDESNDGFYGRAKGRLIHQGLFDHYASRPATAAALLKATEDYAYYNYVDTMRAEQLEKFIDYTKSPAKSALDNYLKSKVVIEKHELEDLLGTKYMRICQWDKAIKWLEQVPASFYNEQGYRLYALTRKIEVEPWIKRQWLKDEDVERANKYKWTIRENIKLTYAKDMQMKEATVNMLSGKALQQRYYDLAVRYAQANFTGDCWYLMRNSKSVMDTVRVNETDLAAKAYDYLQKAALANNGELKAKALFAMGWTELYPSNHWRESVWSEQESQFVYCYNRQSKQFRAFQALFELVDDKPEEGSYISKCDEFNVFRKYYRQHRQ